MDKGDTLSAVVGGRKGWREGGGKGLFASHPYSRVPGCDCTSFHKIRFSDYGGGTVLLGSGWVGLCVRSLLLLLNGKKCYLLEAVT